MLHSFDGNFPKISEDCFIAEGSQIIGNVTIEDGSSVWFNAVIRGDTNKIFIGRKTNIQDNCTIHVNSGDNPVSIGNGVTVGHNAILHGCTIKDNSLIGMGAIILDGAIIGENTMIGAGTLITGGKEIPDGVLCVGSPGRVIRKLSEKEIDELRKDDEHYFEYGMKMKNK